MKEFEHCTNWASYRNTSAIWKTVFRAEVPLEDGTRQGMYTKNCVQACVDEAELLNPLRALAALLSSLCWGLVWKWSGPKSLFPQVLRPIIQTTSTAHRIGENAKGRESVHICISSCSFHMHRGGMIYTQMHKFTCMYHCKLWSYTQLPDTPSAPLADSPDHFGQNSERL